MVPLRVAVRRVEPLNAAPHALHSFRLTILKEVTERHRHMRPMRPLRLRQRAILELLYQAANLFFRAHCNSPDCEAPVGASHPLSTTQTRASRIWFAACNLNSNFVLRTCFRSD